MRTHHICLTGLLYMKELGYVEKAGLTHCISQVSAGPWKFFLSAEVSKAVDEPQVTYSSI